MIHTCPLLLVCPPFYTLRYSQVGRLTGALVWLAHSLLSSLYHYFSFPFSRCVSHWITLRWPIWLTRCVQFRTHLLLNDGVSPKGSEGVVIVEVIKGHYTNDRKRQDEKTVASCVKGGVGPCKDDLGGQVEQAWNEDVSAWTSGGHFVDDERWWVGSGSVVNEWDSWRVADVGLTSHTRLNVPVMHGCLFGGWFYCNTRPVGLDGSMLDLKRCRCLFVF